MTDISSYPKPSALPAQKSMLDTAQQLGTIEQQKVAIDQAKLKQINDQFGLMQGELATLANDPNMTKEKAEERLLNFTKTFNLPPQIKEHMLGELRTAPSVKAFAENAILRGQDINAKVNNIYGVPQVMTNQQQDFPVTVSPMKGVRPLALPIQRQVPPTAAVVDENSQPRMQGPMAPIAPPGVTPGPGLPVARQPAPQAVAPPQGDTGVTTGKLPVEVVADRFPPPSGPATGQTPLFTAGMQAYTQDQASAGAKMLAAKPAIQALPLMQSEGFLSGPLTDQFTKVVAGLKSTGLINIADNADPTAIRQEVAKKLYQYVSASPVGQRSDAAQTLKEASSPNPNVQILPALIKLTKDSVALDRIEAAMPQAFKGKDYQNYIKHKGTFPQSVDERAFTLDLEGEDKRAKIIQDMAKKEKSTNARERNEAIKFFKSLRIADEAGFYQ